MPHIVDALRTLLRGTAAPTSGVVESITSTQARVRTKRGIITYPLNGFAVSPGQTVTLSSSGIIGVSVAHGSADIYDV